MPKTEPIINGAIRASTKDMMTYHTAILGVTGTGKTELAYDFIREAVSRDAKVFCVDLTGLYGDRLSDLDPQELSIDKDTATELSLKASFDKMLGRESIVFSVAMFTALDCLICQQYQTQRRQSLSQRCICQAYSNTHDSIQRAVR